MAPDRRRQPDRSRGGLSMATTSQSDPESAEAPAQIENLGSLTLDEISPEKTLRHMRLSQLLRVREIQHLRRGRGHLRAAGLGASEYVPH